MKKKLLKKKVDLKIMLSNVRGFNSKKDVIDKIIDVVKPSVICLNETGLRGKSKINIKGYSSFTKNRQQKSMGGVSTSVEDSLRASTVKVKESLEEDDEYIITRLDHCIPPLNIINIYGQQESRAGKEAILGSWYRLMNDLEGIQSKGEGCLLLGDMNRKIGNDWLGVMGNKPEISKGGELIRDLLESKEYVLINNTELAEGGPFTREDPGNADNKSCLDLCIVSVNILPYVKRMFIDSGKMFTPYRITKKNGALAKVYTDHYTEIIELVGMPSKFLYKSPDTKWNLMRPGGWDNYERITDDYAESIGDMVKDKELHINEVVRRLDKYQEKIKYAAFGKTKEKGRKRVGGRY